MPYPLIPMPERFARNLIHVTEVPCVLWGGGLDRGGYGVISSPKINGHKTQVAAHRYAWELAHGPIPPGLWVLHHCDVRCCVNVDGCLFLGTNKENVADMVAKARSLRGSRNPQAVLTADQVRAIRAAHAGRRPGQQVTGLATRAQIAQEFGVSVGTVKQIWARTIWSHI